MSSLSIGPASACPTVAMEHMTGSFGRSSLRQSASSKQHEQQPIKHVRFSLVTIRNYDITISDNPAVYSGPPIQLDWQYEEIAPLPVVDFETFKIQRRASSYQRQCCIHNADNGVMIIYPEYRRGILRRAGFSDFEIQQQEKQVQRIQQERLRTKLTFPFYRVEYAMRSAGRKLQRKVARSTTKYNGTSKYHERQPHPQDDASTAAASSAHFSYQDDDTSSAHFSYQGNDQVDDDDISFTSTDATSAELLSYQCRSLDVSSR